MKTILCLCLLLLIAGTCGAETTVKLKNGKTISGTIVSETDDELKLNVEGIALTYFKDDIETIVRDKSAAAAIGAAKAPATSAGTLQNADDAQGVRAAVEAYLAGVQACNLNQTMKPISKDFLFATENKGNIDYNGLRESLAERFTAYKSRKAKIEIRNIILDALKVDPKKNTATVTVRFEREIDYPQEGIKTSQQMKNDAVLTKEDGIWKITAWPTKKQQPTGLKRHNKK